MIGTVNLVLVACAAILTIWLHSTGALRLTSDPDTSAAAADAGETPTVELAINEQIAPRARAEALASGSLLQ